MPGIEAFARARAALGHVVAAAHFATHGRKMVGPAHDAFDQPLDLKTPEPIPAPEAAASSHADHETAPADFHLTYVDNEGQVSERIVTVRAMELRTDGEVLVTCYCHLRHALRVFKCSQIREVFDAATGEVHPDARRFFLAHPLFTDPKDPEAQALRICRSDLVILLTMAAADGRVHPAEMDEVVKHVFNRCPDWALDEALIRERLALIKPSAEAFHKALHRVKCFDRPAAPMLLRALRHVMDADGIVDPAEVAVAEEIEEMIA